MSRVLPIGRGPALPLQVLVPVQDHRGLVLRPGPVAEHGLTRRGEELVEELVTVTLHRGDLSEHIEEEQSPGEEHGVAQVAAVRPGEAEALADGCRPGPGEMEAFAGLRGPRLAASR